MPRSEKALRGALFASYWIIVFLVLFFFSVDDPFCQRAGARNHIVVTAQLALGLALYDSLISLGVAIWMNVARKDLRTFSNAVITTLVVGCGLEYLPFWIYRGHGSFRFENTWADVSCFFTEGYAIVFLFVIAPLLSLTTFARELVLWRWTQRDASLRSV